jgi:rhodanese-related sulfurtransferase
MRIRDYFKPVSSMTTEEAREFLKRKELGDYNLVDVRQPAEYEKGHIPGAQFIPVGELPERLAELDPDKPTITY